MVFNVDHLFMQDKGIDSSQNEINRLQANKDTNHWLPIASSFHEIAMKYEALIASTFITIEIIKKTLMQK